MHPGLEAGRPRPQATPIDLDDRHRRRFLNPRHEPAVAALGLLVA
jgi:hypothetical protein